LRALKAAGGGGGAKDADGRGLRVEKWTEWRTTAVRMDAARARANELQDRWRVREERLVARPGLWLGLGRLRLGRQMAGTRQETA
jgi:hypothetical protein